jgi:hypothetical protein
MSLPLSVAHLRDVALDSAVMRLVEAAHLLDEVLVDLAARAPTPTAADAEQLAQTYGLAGRYYAAVFADTIARHLEAIEEDDESRCATAGCTDDASNGEGFDGYCGNCADQRERDGVYVGTCILTGAAGENADDCTTHEHEGD